MNRPLSTRSISHAGHTPSSRHAPRRDTFTARPVLVMSSPFHASTALWRVPAGEEGNALKLRFFFCGLRRQPAVNLSASFFFAVATCYRPATLP